MYNALLTTLFAGLSTVLGALLAKNSENTKLEAFSLSFATGIMLSLACTQLIPKASENLSVIMTSVLLVFGVILSLLLDIVIPHHHDDDENKPILKEPGHYIDECECSHGHSISQGMVIALLLHNVLEGLANGLTSLSDVKLGISMALAIAIHNIPIGTTLAIAAVSSGHSKSKAVLYCLLIGLAQPLGALIGIGICNFAFTAVLMSASQAIVAGVLIFIAFDEMWPMALKTESRNLNIIVMIIGVVFILLSEAL